MSSKNRLRILDKRKCRKLLIGSIQTHLVPALIKLGFEVLPFVPRGVADRQFVLSFPSWGRLIRPSALGVDLIEIQLAPYRRAVFRINVGVAPKEGLMTVTGRWAAKEVLVHWLNEFFEMYDYPRWRIWFSLRRFPFRSPTQSDYDKLAVVVAGLVPEIELALREGKLESHMRRVVVPRPPFPVEDQNKSLIMAEAITVETDLFEHREVRPHFINPCCFGEDFAAWLKERLQPLEKSGFRLLEIVQEDYGWGFWVQHSDDPFWVALSYVGDGPQEAPAQWVISVNYDPGLNLIKRVFHRPDRRALQELRDSVEQVVKSNAAMKVVPNPQY